MSLIKNAQTWFCVSLLLAALTIVTNQSYAQEFKSISIPDELIELEFQSSKPQVTIVNFVTTNQAINISFEVTNESDLIFTEVTYGLIFALIEGAGEITNFTPADSRTLAPGDTIAQTISMPLSTISNGNYNVSLQIVDRNGSLLAEATIEEVQVDSVNSRAGLVTISNCLFEQEEDTFAAFEGPVFDPTQQASEESGITTTIEENLVIADELNTTTTCRVENLTDSTLELIASYDTREFSALGNIVLSDIASDRKVLGSQESREIDFVYRQPTEPGSYSTRITLFDADTQTQVSNQVTHDFQIDGDSFTFRFSQIEGLSGNLGEEFSLSLSALNQTTTPHYLVIDVVSENGSSCFTSDPFFIEQDAQNWVLKYTLESDCSNPTEVVVGAYNAFSNLVDTIVVPLAIEPEVEAVDNLQNQPEGDSMVGSTYLYLLVSLLIIIISLGLVFLLIKRKKKVSAEVTELNNSEVNK